MNTCALTSDHDSPYIQSLKILVVDDDLEVLASIKDMIEVEADSYVIDTASNFDAALERVQTFKPDIALLDVKLGSANGIELIPAIKAVFPDTICIIMTAYRESEHTIHALRSGADDFLYKPLAPDNLFKIIQHYQNIYSLSRDKALADKRFQVIFQQSYDPLYVLNQFGEIIDINDTAVALSSYNKDEILGTFFTKADWWSHSSNNISLLSSNLNDAIKGRASTEEISIKDTDGKQRYYEFVFTPVQDDENNTIMIISEGRDITARKKIQDNILQVSRTLEQRVKERTLELEKSRDEANRANLAKTQFMSQMSHELRTPLNAILGFTQVMQSNPDEPLQPTQAECLEQVYTAGEHLLALINQVLNLSRIEAGKFTVSLEDTSIKEILDKALSLMQPLATEKSLSLDNITTSYQDCKVIADSQALSQVLINLLSNAVKFNRHEGKIIISGNKTNDGFLRLSVKDTGVGIPADKHDAVFAAFERIENESSVDGTGIGMNVSQQMMEFMNGRIGFDSVEGEGSNFWIELKLAGENNPG